MEGSTADIVSNPSTSTSPRENHGEEDQVKSSCSSCDLPVPSPCTCACDDNDEGQTGTGSNDEVEAVEVEDNNSKFWNKGNPRERAVLFSVGEKKPKLRTSKDVYDRLKWDSASVLIKKIPSTSNQKSADEESEQEQEPLDLNEVYVGYKDRFLGICELPFEEFEPGGEIPYHRVYYFRTGGPPIQPFIGTNGEVKVREDNLPEEAVFIWDRDSRTDLVFSSGNTSYFKD